MSRIGKQSILIPSGVTVNVTGQDLLVKGPKGELSLALHPQASAAMEKLENGDDVLVIRVKDEKADSAIWGTMRALASNMVHGVSLGWSKSLELSGVGFKMKVQGKELVMSLGFSHEIRYDIPEGITASIDGSILTIDGVDAELVGKVASEIRAFKKPEPYKGKGFRYTDEVIRRKVGKAAKTE